MTDLRELLILGLALLILFSLLRAVYVMHRRRKGQIRLSIDKTTVKGEELKAPELSELPNGGARVVSMQEGEDSAARAAVADEELDGPVPGENAPVLLDPVEVVPADETGAETWGGRQRPQHKQRKNWREEIFDSAGDTREGQSDFDMELGAVSITAGERIGGDALKRSKTSGNRSAAAPARREQAVKAHPAESIEAPGQAQAPVSETAEMQPAAEEKSEQTARRSPLDAESDAEAETAAVRSDRIIAINVIAGEDREFAGRELWDFLHAAGLRHDKMKILSKTEGNQENGQPIFRVANIVNPGTFDAETIDEFSTPGISLFMLLPAPINSLLAFEQMLAVARRLAEALEGRLLDFKRQELTAQAVEQARRRIREFDMVTSTSSSVSSRI